MTRSLLILPERFGVFPLMIGEGATVDHRFKPDEWENLTPAQRARRCRLMAEDARALASGASSDLRLHYIKIAGQWLQLAIEIENVAIETRPH
jgi:hypothetical protein